jgi:hypothetical protein
MKQQQTAYELQDKINIMCHIIMDSNSLSEVYWTAENALAPNTMRALEVFLWFIPENDVTPNIITAPGIWL